MPNYEGLGADMEFSDVNKWNKFLENHFCDLQRWMLIGRLTYIRESTWVSECIIAVLFLCFQTVEAAIWKKIFEVQLFFWQFWQENVCSGVHVSNASQAALLNIYLIVAAIYSFQQWFAKQLYWRTTWSETAASVPNLYK